MKRFYHLHQSTDTGQLAIFTDDTQSNVTTGYFEQNSASEEWVIAHNRNTNKFIVQVRVDNEIIGPDHIGPDGLNNIVVRFSEAVSGDVTIIFFE